MRRHLHLLRLGERLVVERDVLRHHLLEHQPLRHLRHLPFATLLLAANADERLVRGHFRARLLDLVPDRLHLLLHLVVMAVQHILDGLDVLGLILHPLQRRIIVIRPPHRSRTLRTLRHQTRVGPKQRERHTHGNHDKRRHPDKRPTSLGTGGH